MDAATPARPRKPIPPASPAALLDALRYPWVGGALAAMTVVLLLRPLAAAMPYWWAGVCQLLLWLALYKYALEALAASAKGKVEPPDVLSNIDDSIHRRHLGVQMVLLFGLSAMLWLAPEWKYAVALGSGVVLPGLIIALAVSQNLLGALNPLNWAVVASRFGLAYPMLALAWAGLVLLQIDGPEWFAALPGVLGFGLFYLLAQYTVLVVFRWMGLALFAHAAELGFDNRLEQRPVLQREREQQAIARGVRQAREAGDPSQRADQLREAVRHGADDRVQQEYREALRASGQRDELDAHARVRVSELVVMGRLRDAAQLLLEALQDNPAFTLPEAPPLNTLLDHLERLTQWRTASALAVNYRVLYPKRRDSLALAARAATVLADELNEVDRAAELLDAAIAQAQPLGEAAALEALRKRLANGIRLRGV